MFCYQWPMPGLLPRDVLCYSLQLGSTSHGLSSWFDNVPYLRMLPKAKDCHGKGLVSSVFVSLGGAFIKREAGTEKNCLALGPEKQCSYLRVLHPAKGNYLF